jgi:hypothetical protein
MHKDIFLFLKEHEDKAQEIVDLFLEETVGNNYEGVVCISGISGCGKSEIAWWVARKLYKFGVSSYVINLDRYYKVNADVRNCHRKETGVIGHFEMDWDRIDKELKLFEVNETRVLIFEGLYANYVTGGINFGIEGNIESSDEFRLLRGKEDETNEWRKYVVGEEYADILRGRVYNDYTI